MRQRAPRTWRLPTPWFPPEIQEDLCGAGSQAIITSAVWPSTNRALYVPFSLPMSATILSLSFACTIATDNYDIGLYDANFAKYESSGSTALATGVQTFTLTRPYRANAGDVLWTGMVVSGTTGAVFRYSGGALSQIVATGAGQEALGSTALPSTATPASLAALFLPLIALGIR